MNPFSENPGEIDKELYDQSLIAEPKETDQIVKHVSITFTVLLLLSTTRANSHEKYILAPKLARLTAQISWNQAETTQYQIHFNGRHVAI